MTALDRFHCTECFTRGKNFHSIAFTSVQQYMMFIYN